MIRKRIRLTKKEMELIDNEHWISALSILRRRTNLGLMIARRILNNYQYGGYKSMTVYLEN